MTGAPRGAANPGGGRRVWLLVALTAALVPGTIALNRAVGFDEWRTAVGWSPAALPSTHAVAPAEVSSGLPVLSLVVAEADLHDPDRGILANVMQHGAEWEREGSVSYFDNGRLRFATGVGVRVHGGGSRLTSERQGFRLYFRRRYGATQVPPGVLFGDDAQPIRRLVVHNDVRVDRDGTKWHFANPLAYDIAEALGAIAPDTKPVRFFVNGEFYGVFVLTERIDDHFFEAHWDHGRIRLDQAEFDKLWAWVSGTRPLTMTRVSERVDLDNLTRWFLAVAFTATRDAYQGPGQLEDRTRAQAPWFWVNWDMDQGFRSWDLDSYQYLLERIGEDRRGRNRAEPRPTILTNLLAEDAEFRAYFKRAFQDAMNHRLTTAFLEERFRHYESEARALGVESTTYLPRLHAFLEKRPAFFWAITESWLNTEPAQTLTVDVSARGSVLIDGVAVTGSYEGKYFPDLDVTLSVPADARRRFRGWYVDGQPAGADPEMTIRVTHAMRVTPSFGAVPPPPALPPANVQTAATAVVATGAAPPALSWTRIPGAGFEMLTTEVTAAQYGAFAAHAGVRAPTQPAWYAEPNHPVTNVTWDEAAGFCAWTGGRLPTEAEWERAAIGRTRHAPYPWEGRSSGHANIQGQTGIDRWPFTAPVGSLPPNDFGLFDMWGNVWEWTSDVITQATWPGYDMRVVRGGSWDTSPRPSRVWARIGLARNGRHNLYVGFRCAR